MGYHPYRLARLEVPLLSWVRGRGWTRDPAVAMNGETVTSEDFTLSALRVTAPTEYPVLGTGTAVENTAGPTPTTTHRFAADAVRDVAVGVGRYDVTPWLDESLSTFSESLVLGRGPSTTPATSRGATGVRWAAR